MAYQTGVIQYKGSFKSIRNYKNRKDSNLDKPEPNRFKKLAKNISFNAYQQRATEGK
jgi:hypothetical protein